MLYGKTILFKMFVCLVTMTAVIHQMMIEEENSEYKITRVTRRAECTRTEEVFLVSGYIICFAIMLLMILRCMLNLLAALAA